MTGPRVIEASGADDWYAGRAMCLKSNELLCRFGPGVPARGSLFSRFTNGIFRRVVRAVLVRRTDDDDTCAPRSSGRERTQDAPDAERVDLVGARRIRVR